MSNAIAVVTESGFGKTTSLGSFPELNIEGLNPKETLIINIKGKPLPWRGWKTQYERFDTSVPPTKGNYLTTTDPGLIIKTMLFFNANRPDINNIVIDDFQYLMAEEFMANALKTGFDKYNKLAKNAYDVINTGLNLRDDLNFIILTHSENTNDGYKMKTIGKMLDEKVTLQGLFTIVLYGKTHQNPETKEKSRVFITNEDENYPAKSPIGMFNDLYIPNDLGYVVKTANNYYNAAAS